MDSKNDAELVHLARAGNRDAYGELIRRYQRPIWGLASILLDDRFEAEDITQEAFLRAWLNLDLLSDPARFAPWLRRIVFGVSVDWLRVFRPDLYRLSDEKAECELSMHPDRTESPVARLEAIELRQRILGRGCVLASEIPVAPDDVSPRWAESQQGSRGSQRAGKHSPFAGYARARNYPMLASLCWEMYSRNK
jgi:hypothetical protein